METTTFKGLTEEKKPGKEAEKKPGRYDETTRKWQLSPFPTV